MTTQTIQELQYSQLQTPRGSESFQAGPPNKKRSLGGRYLSARIDAMKSGSVQYGFLLNQPKSGVQHGIFISNSFKLS